MTTDIQSTPIKVVMDLLACNIFQECLFIYIYIYIYIYTLSLSLPVSPVFSKCMQFTSIVKIVKYRRLQWAGHETEMNDIRNAYAVLVESLHARS